MSLGGVTSTTAGVTTVTVLEHSADWFELVSLAFTQNEAVPPAGKLEIAAELVGVTTLATKDEHGVPPEPKH